MDSISMVVIITVVCWLMGTRNPVAVLMGLAMAGGLLIAMIGG